MYSQAPFSWKGFVVFEVLKMLKRWVGVGVLLGGLLLAAQSWAGMAAWYWWESQATGRLVCAQVSPGEGWRLFSGPYNNGGCREN